MKPLAIDLCCGLGGWAHGLIAEDWEVMGFDIERHEYGNERYPGQLIIQDIRTIDGAQFRGKASLVVASPPCTEFSYMAMPWKRGKQIATALRGKGEFPVGYRGSRTIAELRELFDACVRIGREAGCPTIIENVRGAQPWVGRATNWFGSFYLWGDVPALMPITMPRLNGAEHELSLIRAEGVKAGDRNVGGKWTNSFADMLELNGQKTVGHLNKRNGHEHTRHLTNQAEHFKTNIQKELGRKLVNASEAIKNLSGRAWYASGLGSVGSKSNARKAASAMIAKIPLVLARHIAKVYYPKLSLP